jgi:hypothetical protein
MDDAAAPAWRARLWARRGDWIDVLGLLAIELVLLDYLRPSLLFLSTIAAGGDTPCHYPTAAWFQEKLWPHLRLHGWWPGGYVGQPLLLYYFPVPFVLMAVLAPFTGLPVAFKLGTAGGVFLLPLLAYAAFRLMRFRAPGPLLAAGAAFVFLFLEDNPIWGGTLASTLAGEFSYTYGVGFALLFLGVVYRARSRGDSFWLPALALALTALAHGYAVLWAGLSASFFLFGARQPGRTLRWLLAVGALAFALAAFFLLPLLSAWGWTTPYDDPWITVAPRNLFPPLLWPLFAAALLGLGAAFLARRRSGGVDRRLLYLLHAAAVGAALTAAGPALGIIDVRFAPFAQFALCLLGAAAIAEALRLLRAAPLAGLGVLGLLILQADMHSKVLRSWVDYNYTGLEAKELWPAWREMTARLSGGPGSPRATVEYSSVHEKAGSIRMYETLPFFTGRGTLEGVYNQASLQTHFVYYLTSELGAVSPNPFRSREYSRFDTAGALAHLRAYNVQDVVAVSDQLIASLGGRSRTPLLFRVPPYSVFRLTDHGPGYVEPLAFQPVRAGRDGWRDAAYRWWTRRPLSRALLVFSDDPQFALAQRDPWLAPPEVALPGGVRVTEAMGDEEIRITTDRIGHPLLVKVSYHPRWRVEGADGPFLVSPALMMVVPRQENVRLHYGRTASDHLGLALSLGALLAGAGAFVRRRRAPAPPPAEGGAVLSRLAASLSPDGTPQMLDACALPKPPRRWGWTIPAALLALLVAGRFLPTRRPLDPAPLFEQASSAYARGQFEDAAEYARHALEPSRGTPLFGSLLVLRGESLLAAARPEPAAEAFEAAVGEGGPGGAYVPQALFGAARARQLLKEPAAASRLRARLLGEFADTPWAERARRELQP